MSKKDENKLERESITVADFRVWKQRQNLSSEDIIHNIVRNQAKIRNYTEALNEEEKNDKKKKIKNYQSFDALRNRKQKDSKLSDNVQKIMSEVGKLVIDMKHISENAYKNNINSLMNTTKQIKKTEIINDSNTILKVKEKEFKASLEGKTKKTPNYQFLADCYRKQINRAFVNYNPNIHLSNIYKLKETEPETNKEYQIRSKEIDEFTNKKNAFILRQYGKGDKKNKSKEIKEDNLEEKSNLGINNSSVGYTIATAESENNSQIQSAQIISPPINLFGKKHKNKKVEIKKKFPEKEKREKELNLMSNVLDNIGNAISSENLGNYFDRYKDLKGTEISQQRHVFFKGIGKANKLLTEIQEILHYKDADDDANIKKRIITNESDALVEKLGVLKKSAINEIDVFEKKENKIYSQK
jgi:hypothetical protein